MIYWVFVEIGGATAAAIDQAVAGMMIVFFCVTGTGGMCR
jgi:hypothetical protein